MTLAARIEKTPTLEEARQAYVLRLGDNALILGQRLGEWCGHGPVLEEDIALTNMALDLIGQARSWLSLAGELEGEGRDEDQLAYLRDAGAFQNLTLLELPNGDYGQTTLRRLLFDAWHLEVLEALAVSGNETIAGIAAKSAKEVAYHFRHSAEWTIRLGDGTDESHARMTAALDYLWPYAHELFAADEVDTVMLEAGEGADLAAIEPAWDARIDAVFEQAKLARPHLPVVRAEGKLGRHSEHLGFILAEMQFLQRAYPGAKW